MDFRDKSFNYDFIVEEFHYEYKLNVQDIIKTLINIKNSVEGDIIDNHDLYKQLYPEKSAKELLEEYKENTDHLEDYFNGYKEYRELARLCISWKKTDDQKLKNNIESEIELISSNFSIPIICDRYTTEESLLAFFQPHLSITKSIFFAQSPKDKKTDLPSIHYSLKEKFLSDFRAIRKKAKNKMEEAEANDDHDEYVRYNSKQLAIKKICNSEYGASGNKTFAHYDPDIAAAVTHCARSLIGFLTCNLESKYLYVTEEFLNKNKEHINVLIACNACSIEEKEYSHEELYRERRHALRKIYDDKYELIPGTKVFKLIMKPSKVVYQDTDSNYYINPHIRDHFTNKLTECSPEAVDKMMWAMYHHDLLLSNFAADCVSRRPIGLGFEGSFITCRYLNRKKRYYGKQWSADGTLFPVPMLKNPDAYVDNVLKESYDEYFKKKESCMPYTDGTYIQLDYNVLLNSNVNYLDYVKSFGVKCTGIDLVRRDQYKCINFFHVYILKNDLQIMKYEGNNNWKISPKNKPMQEIIKGAVEDFKKLFDSAREFVLKPTTKFERNIKFRLIDFSKTAAYRPNKNNPARIIHDRIIVEKEEKPDMIQYLPKVNERLTYVVLKGSGKLVTENVEVYEKVLLDATAMCRKIIINNLNGHVTDIEDKIDPEKCEESNEVLFEGTSFAIDLQMDYTEFYSAFILNMLDCKYYIKCLCSALALYIIGDVYPEEISELDSNEVLSQKEINNIVSKYQKKVADMLFFEQYPELKPKSASKKLYTVLSKDGKALQCASELFMIINKRDFNKKPIGKSELESFINNKLKCSLFNSIEALLEQDDYNPEIIDQQIEKLYRLFELLKLSAEENDEVIVPADLITLNKQIFGTFTYTSKDKDVKAYKKYNVIPNEINQKYVNYFENTLDKMIQEAESRKGLLKRYVIARDYLERKYNRQIP